MKVESFNQEITKLIAAGEVRQAMALAIIRDEVSQPDHGFGVRPEVIRRAIEAAQR